MKTWQVGEFGEAYKYVYLMPERIEIKLMKPKSQKPKPRKLHVYLPTRRKGQNQS